MTKTNYKNIKLQLEARDIIKSRAFELLVDGKVRSSKTYSILAKIHALMSKYPNSRGLILRKTKSSLAQSILQTFEDEILGSEHYLLENAPRRENRQSYHYRNGSELVIAGLDKPGKIMSSEYDIVYVAEATETTEDDLMHLVTRMSCNHFKHEGEEAWQQIILDCNPSYPHHWLNQRFMQLSEKRKRIFISHKCNPKLWNIHRDDWTPHGKKYMENLEATLTGVQRSRLLEGRWCIGDKLVYSEFNPDIHITSDPPEDIERVVVGVDFGWKVGAVVVVGFYKDRAYVLETHMHTKKQISEWIEILQGIRTRTNVNYSIVADSAEPRSIEQIKNAGLPIEPVKKGTDSVRIGIELIKSRLNDKMLYILSDSQKSNDLELKATGTPVSIAEEFYCYETDTKTDKPISKYNHALDALRYVFLTIDSTPSFEFVISGDGDESDSDMWRNL